MLRFKLWIKAPEPSEVSIFLTRKIQHKPTPSPEWHADPRKYLTWQSLKQNERAIKKTWFTHLLWLFLWSLQLAFWEAPRRLESMTYSQSPGFCTGPSWTSCIPLLGMWGLQHGHEWGGKRGLACVLLNATWHWVIRKHKSACPLPDLP